MAENNVMMVVGSQWGDEGKGKLVDYLSDKVDVCARCQGGNNAGHTIVVGDVKYDFHLLPSGIAHKGCVNVIGNGVVIHIQSLFDELAKFEAKGGPDYTGRLLISDRAHIVFDLHQKIDGLKEAELGKGSLGTTKRGIGPTYSSKASRGGIRVGDLRFEAFKQRYRDMVAHKAQRFPGHFTDVDIEEEIARYVEFGKRLEPYICDTVYYINKAVKDGKKVMVEGANACLLDIDLGTYPFVTSSNTTCGGASTGLGLSPNKIARRFGVVKAYTTRVGEGPFPTELHCETGEKLRAIGHEFGTTTGRPRRCGWLDLVLLAYSHLVNDYTDICITKLDCLTGFEVLPIAIAYKVNGEPLQSFPGNLEVLGEVEVEYYNAPGWTEDISAVRKFEDLPVNAQKYVQYIEEFLACPATWIGVGPERDAIIDRSSA